MLLDFPDFPSRDDLKRISQETGQPLANLVALGIDADPFLAGTPTQERNAQKFMEITAGVNIHTHLRGLHYRLLNLASTLYDGDWEWLQKGSRSARDLGYVEPWAFPDKRTRALLSNMRGDGEEIEYEIVKPVFYVPTEPDISRAMLREFSGMTAQPVRGLVLIEKDDDDVLAEVYPACAKAGVELRITTGFSPKTLAGRLAQEATLDPRPLVVFVITDADSSGEHMAVVTGRHLEFLSKRYDLPPIYLDRIALTLDQVDEIEEEIGKPIPLAPDVKREIGRVELNALPVYAPGWLGRQVETALESMTVEIEEPEVEVPEELQEMLDKAKRIEQRLYDRIGERVRYVERIVDDALREWEPDPVEVDVPEPDLDLDWILDTERDYLTQLNSYRYHGQAHRDTEPLALAERVCLYCGESIAHRAVQARYCDAVCTDRARRERT